MLYIKSILLKKKIIVLNITDHINSRNNIPVTVKIIIKNYKQIRHDIYLQGYNYIYIYIYIYLYIYWINLKNCTRSQKVW